MHEAGYEERAIELRVGTAATAIDPAERTVTLADGERLRWDRLLLAQGAEPAGCPCPGRTSTGCSTCATWRTATACATLRAGGRLVVIGAGWIGAGGRLGTPAGLEVSLLERLAVPLEHVLGPTVGAIYADLHRERGVDLRTAWRSRRSRGPAASSACACPTGGHRLHGRRRRGRRAPAHGPRRGRGARGGERGLVDATLRTSAPGVYAAGDVANAAHPFYGRRVRVEHWANALHQGRPRRACSGATSPTSIP